MNETFGVLALALSGVAARRLGWRPDEFWRATPAELRAALDTSPAEPASLDRATLQRLMENDHG
jgi:uncharacterized phage protein (TIGR02216 family)